jgi:putative membrane-bound dehydrogenase-like protein
MSSTRDTRRSASLVRSRAHALLGTLALAAALALLPSSTIVGVAQVSSQTPMIGQTTTLDPAQAAKEAAETRRTWNVQVADGLELTVWAPMPLVADPFDIDIDSHGVAYVSATPRTGQLLDIRGHADWVPEVHTLTTTDALRQFFTRVMAPERSAQNTWLPDYNGDGSRDWRDISVIKERIYRVEDTNGDGVADRSRVVFEGFNEDVASDILGSILLHGSDLYATAAPDLWRLRDTDGDGVFDSKTSLSHGYSVHPAFSGHDMSALTIGPDGRLYWKIGDIGMNVTDATGRQWAYPNRGVVLRAEPDGSHFEVFATGIRNTQEIAFDEHGNMVSVDNDGDYPGESERVVYITYGSDAGWRSTWQYGKYTDPANNRYNVWIDEGMFKPHFDGQAAYIVPPVASYHAGPSGFAFNPGTALDARWRDHFFVTSFTGGASTARVYAFQLKEHGAGFDLANDTEVVRGVLSPGMRIGPDGAIYLTDWVSGWGANDQGRVWKLDSKTGAADPMRAEVRTLLQADFAPKSASDLRALLRHVDMRVREKAQFALVDRGDAATLLAAAREDDQQLARIHGLWGLGQLARKNAGQAASLVPFLTDADAEIRAQAAKLLGDVRDKAAVTPLIALLRDAAPRPRFFAAEALGRIGDPAATQPLIAMLADNDDRDVYLRHAGSAALASIGDVQAIAALATHPSRAVRLAAVVALRRLHDAGVARFLGDTDAAVATEAARAINDETGIPAAVPALARMLTDTRVTSEAFLRRAISASSRLGDAESTARLAAFARRTDAAAPVRAEAARALGAWLAPSRFDRVDGAELGAALSRQRDAAGARSAMTSLVALLDQPDTDMAMKVAVIEGAARLDLKDASPAIMTRLRTDTASSVRIAALRALQTLGAPELDEAVRLALAGSDGALRMAAIGTIAASPLPDADKAAHLGSVIKSGSTGEQQAALAGLATVKGPAAETLLGDLLQQVSAGAIAPEVTLDVLEAAQANGSPALAARLDAMRVGRTLDRLAAVFPNALMRGGDARRGFDIAGNNPAAQCGRCHTIGGSTASVGPNLTHVGSQLSREQLLQALLDPSARIAPGFGAVSVTLKNGRTVDGLLRDESARQLVIEDASGARQTVATADIASRRNAPSAMPPMGTVLEPHEIRDLVEMLATFQ